MKKIGPEDKMLEIFLTVPYQWVPYMGLDQQL